MPFDALPENIVSDVIKLRLARNGIAEKRTIGELGLKGEEDHCALGWLLEAADHDPREAARLAVQYLWPAMPKSARNGTSKVWAIAQHHDHRSTDYVVRWFDRAIAIAT